LKLLYVHVIVVAPVSVGACIPVTFRFLVACPFVRGCVAVRVPGCVAVPVPVSVSVRVRGPVPVRN
jgi:hypothetical protein